MSSRSHCYPSHCEALALLGLQERIGYCRFKSPLLRLSNSWHRVVTSSRLDTGYYRRKAAA